MLLLAAPGFGLARLKDEGAEPLRLDVADPASVSGLAWQLDGEKLDVALYVAGVMDRRDGPRTVNPHLVKVRWGARLATLHLGAGEPLPWADRSTFGGRLSGIVTATEGMAPLSKTVRRP